MAYSVFVEVTSMRVALHRAEKAEARLVEARRTIAQQADDIRRLVSLVSALGSERAPMPTDSADFIAGYNAGFNRCKGIKERHFARRVE